MKKGARKRRWKKGEKKEVGKRGGKKGWEKGGGKKEVGKRRWEKVGGKKKVQKNWEKRCEKIDGWKKESGGVKRGNPASKINRIGLI